jgi:Domain of Unknown Function (DUF748)
MKLVRILAALLLAVGLYALLGFVLAPKLIRNAILDDVPKTTNATASVGDIHLNPFLLQLDVRDLAIKDKGGAQLLGFERLFVDFELSSLWHRAYSFARIEISAPYVSAVVAPDGTLNLMALEPKPQPPSTPPPVTKKPAPLPSIRIDSFKVSQGSVSYEDKSRPSDFAARLEPIAFELKNFSTGVAGGLFTFSGASKLGEKIEWHGHLSVQPVASDGEFHIEALRAHTVWEYLESQLNFAIASGTIDVEATYKFSLTDRVNLALAVANTSVTDLLVRPKDSDTDWIALPALQMTGAAVDLGERSASVDAVSLTGLKVLAWLEPDGAINLLKLALPAGGSANAAANSGTPPPAAPSNGAPAVQAHDNAPPPVAPWKVELRELALHEASISVEDRTVQPTVKLLLAPLSLDVQGASSDLTKPVKIALDSRVNQTGSITVGGEVTAQPAAATVDLKLAGIDLATAQPYVAQQTAMTLHSGKLGGALRIEYGAKQAPTIKAAGDLYVEGLRTVDNTLHDDLIDWERLDVRGMRYQHAPDRLDIAEVAVRKPYARVIIESDTSLNVSRVLAGPGSAQLTPPAQAPRNDSPKPKAVTVKTVAVKAPAPTTPASTPTMPLSIKSIRLLAGQANFTDLSITPNFSAGIKSLEGSITGLSSSPDSRAKVDLHGKVDEFSPVSIAGEVNLLSATTYTDLTMSFKDINLSIFNPYSGKFAGYNITKGQLTADMHYKVVKRQLDAQHRIRIDQLEFGDKTASKDAVSLPVKLAVALLKDRNGLIDLPLPVTGSLDDPHFRVWPIIWKVLVNIVEKAVTAPFALLGSLFGGGPDLQFIDFKPGSSTLDAAGTEKMKSIVKALKERPQIKIEVPIATVADLDRPALAGAAFDHELDEMRAQAAEARGKAAAAAAPPFDQLDPATRLDLLARLYAKDLGSEPKYPDEISHIKGKPDLLAAKLEFLTRAVREHASVGDDQLTALGQERAQSLQRALLTDTDIDASRVFLVANDKAAAKDGQVRLELSLR